MWVVPGLEEMLWRRGMKTQPERVLVFLYISLGMYSVDMITYSTVGVPFYEHAR